MAHAHFVGSAEAGAVSCAATPERAALPGPCCSCQVLSCKPACLLAPHTFEGLGLLRLHLLTELPCCYLCLTGQAWAGGCGQGQSCAYRDR